MIGDTANKFTGSNVWIFFRDVNSILNIIIVSENHLKAHCVYALNLFLIIHDVLSTFTKKYVNQNKSAYEQINV